MTLGTADTFQPGRFVQSPWPFAMNSAIHREPITEIGFRFRRGRVTRVILSRHLRSREDPGKRWLVMSFTAPSLHHLSLFFPFPFYRRYNPATHMRSIETETHRAHVTGTISNKKQSEVAGEEPRGLLFYKAFVGIFLVIALPFPFARPASKGRIV